MRKLSKLELSSSLIDIEGTKYINSNFLALLQGLANTEHDAQGISNRLEVRLREERPEQPLASFCSSVIPPTCVRVSFVVLPRCSFFK
eukprot:72470-Amphidinium_carterae.1